MRSIQLGIAIVIAGGVSLCGLLLATLWVSAQSIPPSSTTPAVAPPVAIAQTGPSLQLTATVGTDRGVCATGDTVQVRANTPVYYCFTVRNSGNVDLTLHQLDTARQREITDSLALTLVPNAVTNTVSLGLVISDVTGVDASNRITWTVLSVDPDLIITDQVTIDIVGPSLLVEKTVGQDRNRCASATTLRIPTAQSAFYCVTLQNQGDTPLIRHSFSDPPLGISGSFAYTLSPGARLVITPGMLNTLGILGFLGHNSVSTAFTNTVNVTSFTANNLSASASATTTLSVGSTTVQFSKTVGTDPNVCATTPSISVPPGLLYYCVTIRNTSSTVTLTHHSLVEDALSINLNFDYPLPPGSVMTVTNAFLAANNQPIVFGPFEFSNRFPSVVNSSMSYTGTSPIGDRVTANGTTFARFIDTPTPTRTDTPEPPDTPTLAPTWTPSLTPIPPTPTETPTPTFTPVTPTPTPTRSYAISLLETPTPSQPQQPPTPFIDPAFLAVTLTAQAATATAAAGQFGSPLQPPFGSPLETPTPDLFFLPTPAQPQPGFQSPLEMPTLPPTPTPVFVLGDTPTPAPVVVIVTNTPGTETTGPLPGQLPPGQRPVVPPTPTPTPDYVMFAATMLDSFLLTIGWIWFFAGSLVFFVSAGIVVGLFFRQQERRRFDLVAGDLEDGALVAPPSPYTPGAERTTPEAEDEWPDSLP